MNTMHVNLTGLSALTALMFMPMKGFSDIPSLQQAEQAVLSAQVLPEGPHAKAVKLINDSGPLRHMASLCGKTLTLVAGSMTEGVITITNHAIFVPATNIHIENLPSGISETSNSCDIVYPGETCQIGLQPSVSAVPLTTLHIYGDNTTETTIDVRVNVVAVGDNYQGGFVYAIQGNTVSIAADTDESPGVWDPASPYASIITTDTDGQTNTRHIIEQIGQGSYAALSCAQYNSGGYSDWYLPAVDQLATLLNYAQTVPPLYKYFLNGPAYWSSTQDNNPNNAFTHTLLSGSGDPTPIDKGSVNYVRCTRTGT